MLNAGEKFLQQEDKDPLKEAQEADDATEEVAIPKLRCCHMTLKQIDSQVKAEDYLQKGIEPNSKCQKTSKSGWWFGTCFPIYWE